MLKSELLSYGIALTSNFLNNYGAPYLEKRRAYGNSDPKSYQSVTVPQELYFGSPRLVCSVNIRPDSRWELDFFDGTYILRNIKTLETHVVDFPRRPTFYDLTLSGGLNANAVATLYGGGALGIFIYGSCALVDEGKACRYCSIKPNRLAQSEFEQVIRPEQVYEVVRAALASDSETVTQIMINGGNFKNGDKSFKYYIEVCKAARKALDEMGSKIELHLIAYPPDDLDLFSLLKPLNVSLAMNTEAYNLNVFNFICPGKNQAHLLNALKTAAKILGPGKVYSIFVGGLENLSDMAAGFRYLAGIKVTPIINVFHPDPETDLESMPPPLPEQIMAMGKVLQHSFSENPFMKPFYDGCGRNAIDSEAYLGLFEVDI